MTTEQAARLQAFEEAADMVRAREEAESLVEGRPSVSRLDLCYKLRHAAIAIELKAALEREAAGV